MTTQAIHGWYARPVLFVAGVNRAIRSYVDRLDFWKKWQEANGPGTVRQVNRGDCEIILCQDSTRTGGAWFFVELNVEELAELRRLLVERSIPSKRTWWGYDSTQIDDPDDHEWVFPVEGNSPAKAAGAAAGDDRQIPA